MVFKSTTKPIYGRQNTRMEVIAFRVDDSAVGASLSTDGLVEGSNYGKILTSATGVYQIQLNRACARIPVVLGAIALGELFLRLTSEPTAAGLIEVTLEADDGTNTDGDFHISLLTFYDATER